MKTHPLLFIAILTICFFNTRPSMARNAATETADDTELESLQQWKAYTEVRPENIQRFGLERCFCITEIDSILYRRIRNKSYKPACPVPCSDLRYLKVLHYTHDGRIRLGELVCHRSISKDLLAIFRTLYDARYPIERMTLIDDYDADDIRSMEANNTSCFNFRKIQGSTRISKHGTGLAIDINPRYNPYVRTRNGQTIVSPRGSAPYADRTRNFPYKIDTDDLCYRTFRKYGFTWGGSWRSLKDYQHFEK